MQTNVKHVRILVLLFSSLATLFFALLGMTIVWNYIFVNGYYPFRVFVVFAAGILSFLVGVVIFWHLTELLSLKEVRK